MKVGLDDGALSFGEESKELVSLVYIHSLFTYFQMTVCHGNMVKSRVGSVGTCEMGSSHLRCCKLLPYHQAGIEGQSHRVPAETRGLSIVNTERHFKHQVEFRFRFQINNPTLLSHINLHTHTTLFGAHVPGLGAAVTARKLHESPPTNNDEPPGSSLALSAAQITSYHHLILYQTHAGPRKLDTAVRLHGRLRPRLATLRTLHVLLPTLPLKLHNGPNNAS